MWTASFIFRESGTGQIFNIPEPGFTILSATFGSTTAAGFRGKTVGLFRRSVRNPAGEHMNLCIGHFNAALGHILVKSQVLNGTHKTFFGAGR